MSYIRDIYTNDLSIENADNGQSDLYKRFSNLNKRRKLSENVFFLKNVKTLLKEFVLNKNVLNNFKNNLLPIISTTTCHSTPRELEKYQ